MNKRDVLRYKSRFLGYLEPFAIVALLAIFILPLMAVVNLSPQTKEPTPRLDVLGVQTEDQLVVEHVSGTHSVISNERLSKDNDTIYTYSASLLPTVPGAYSKPIIQISNGTDSNVTLEFSLTDQEQSSTQIGILFDNTEYVLRSSEGDLYSKTITLNPGNEKTVFLRLHADERVNFSEEIELKVISSLE